MKKQHEQIKNIIINYMNIYFKQIPYKIEIDNIGDLQITLPILYSALIEKIKESFIFLWHSYPIQVHDMLLTVTKFYQIKTKTKTP